MVWKPRAKNRLAHFWNQSTDRQAVTAAANRIEVLLRDEADSVDESRGSNRRILLELPLGVIYEVSPMDRLVTVLAVWEIRTKP